MFNSNTFHLPALKPDISSSTALSSQVSALSPQLSSLSPQPSSLSPQLSSLSSQLSALSSQLSALSPQLCSFTCPKGTQFSHPLGLRDATPARAGASSADLSDHLRATRATSHLYTFTLLYIHTLLHEKRIRTSRQRPWPKTRTLW